MKTTGYVLDESRELDKMIEQAMDPKLRLALVNLALPPVSHVFIIMKLKHELRVYDVQNHYASGGEVPTWYHNFSNDYFDCTGYRSSIIHSCYPPRCNTLSHNNSLSPLTTCHPIPSPSNPHHPLFHYITSVRLQIFLGRTTETITDDYRALTVYAFSRDFIRRMGNHRLLC